MEEQSLGKVVGLSAGLAALTTATWAFLTQKKETKKSSKLRKTRQKPQKYLGSPTAMDISKISGNFNFD
jgi:hypothetical protein